MPLVMLEWDGHDPSGIGLDTATPSTTGRCGHRWHAAWQASITRLLMNQFNQASGCRRRAACCACETLVPCPTRARAAKPWLNERTARVTLDWSTLSTGIGPALPPKKNLKHLFKFSVSIQRTHSVSWWRFEWPDLCLLRTV